jgi:hypothetical protein
MAFEALMKSSGGCLLTVYLALAAPQICAQTADDAMDHSKTGHAMRGMYGPYSMTREASGTSWQPDSSPHEGIMAMTGEWMTMIHGFVNQVYDDQGGPRGDTKNFSSSMLMVMGQRALEAGTLGLRGMVSADALMGKGGYPLLLQTGETADGQNPR